MIIPIRKWLRRAVPGHRNAGFQPEDGLDVVFGGANPNPERIGCPGASVIQSAARGALPLDHPAYDHLASCSECYRESRAWQSAGKGFRAQPFAAAAAVLILLAGGVYVGRNHISGLPEGAPTKVVLDYQNDGVNRSESGGEVLSTRYFPRASVDLTMLMPTGSEAGRYEFRLLRPDGTAVISRATTALKKDFALRLQFALDLRSLKPGPYTVQTRRAGEEWDSHPVMVQ